MKKTFLLEGLDCANCAAKLERAVAQLDSVSAASVDFMASKLHLETAEGQMEAVAARAQEVIAKVEPGVRMLPWEGAKRAPRPASKHEGCADGCCGCAGHEHLDHAHDHESDEHQHAHDHGHEEVGRDHNGEEDYGHAHSHSEEEEAEHGGSKNGYIRTQIIRIVGSGVILVAAMLLPDMMFLTELLMFLVAYLLIGGDILLRAVKNIFRGHVFDENFLMAIATVGAFCIGEYAEGVFVMLFYQVGESFQYYAVNRSRKSIAGLMDIRPDYANVLVNGELIQGRPEDVEVGDVIVVKAGEKIPLDGRILEGVSSIDASALTGESLPREAAPGGEVLSGCINLSGMLKIEVTKEFGESTVSKILDLVENAGSKKASTENFITKFAKYYTPIVVGVAALLAVLPPLLLGGGWNIWVYRALSFLVVSCPCALVISIPLGFFGGIGGASRRGILIKGGNYLEALADAEIMVFDKTGTLTKGSFHVTQMNPQGVTEAELLELAALAESYSNHPISLSIKAAHGRTPESGRVADVEEIAGQGVRAMVDGAAVLAGNARLMAARGISCFEGEVAGTVVHVARDNAYLGYLVIADEVKPDAKQAISALKAAGVRKTVMLTGDARRVGEAVAAQLGIDEAHTELLPADKVEQMERLLAQKTRRGKLAFVGDGINDAPVLARADIGIAMGGLGSDAAIEAADVVIMNDEPSRIATAMEISRKTLRIVKQNILFALGIKVLVLVLVAFGMSSMWEAVFADVGVSVIAILNSMRALNTKKIK